ncbi:hypothetical protein HLB23_04055 [Nocardia uniformis]|uniref:Uncharacterized protein n=1 Tax=Nocardia uniformis TaxID=53432 RepID=A0A849BQS9_9NOCA|nr:hypothetical protein [Nocardia uniformis]NNH69052.1 hypothetical protein [Nocardia uniformis]
MSPYTQTEIVHKAIDDLDAALAAGSRVREWMWADWVPSNKPWPPEVATTRDAVIEKISDVLEVLGDAREELDRALRSLPSLYHPDLADPDR